MSQGIPKEFWDARFSEDGYAYGDRPSRLLLGWSDHIQTHCHTALVPACGQGRDAVFLARLGLNVTAIDISAVGLERTRELAAHHGVHVETIEADLFAWDWPVAKFDVVASMFAHMPSAVRPKLHSLYSKSLAPGGFVFMEGFTKDQIAYQERYQSGGPPNIDMLYSEDDLRDDFSDLETRSMLSGVEVLNEGPYHTGPAALLRAVFSKTGN